MFYDENLWYNYWVNVCSIAIYKLKLWPKYKQVVSKSKGSLKKDKVYVWTF